MRTLRKKDRQVISLIREGASDLQVCRQLGLAPEQLEQVLSRISACAENEEDTETALSCERTLRRRSENAARSLAGRFAALLEASPEAILVIDGLTGAIRQVNERAATMFGYPADGLVGRSMEDLVPDRYRAIHPAYRVGFLSSIRKREMGYHPPIFGRRADGSDLEIAIALTASTTDEEVMVVCSEFARWNRLAVEDEQSAVR